MEHNQTVQMYIILDTEMLHSKNKLMLIKTHQLMKGLHLELQIFYFLSSEVDRGGLSAWARYHGSYKKVLIYI